jgi:hypothetical protein
LLLQVFEPTKTTVTEHPSWLEEYFSVSSFQKITGEQVLLEKVGLLKKVYFLL